MAVHAGGVEVVITAPIIFHFNIVFESHLRHHGVLLWLISNSIGRLTAQGAERVGCMPGWAAPLPMKAAFGLTRRRL